MRRSNHIELGDGTVLTILHEDRSVIAIDKPATWMLVPYSWQKTNRNLQAALVSSIGAGDHWARSRNLKFLRHVHRLDAETSGVLLFARSQGAVEAFGRLFESRLMAKAYLVVVHGVPREEEWTCREPIAQDPRRIGRMKVDAREGKPAETHFRVLERGPRSTLLEATPITGRTHQIRVHLLARQLPVVGDELYGPDKKAAANATYPLGLRSVFLGYQDPFTRRPVRIEAPVEEFVKAFGFRPPPDPKTAPAG